MSENPTASLLPRQKGGQMGNVSTAPTHVGRPSLNDLVVAVVEALAKVRAASVGEIRDEMVSAGGDVEVDSREAEAVIAMLETRYGRTLAKVEDLEPECLPSVSSLAGLLDRRWPAGSDVTQTSARDGGN